ncbi:adenine deaminase [Tistrella sp. BH-R2-4]|uniref:Adenine deaminase n=1 Tax=Tistrella arctica TaxID=3133430 RepID=A0ABU9YKJ4_9PROT
MTSAASRDRAKATLKRRIDQALGRDAADLVVRGGRVLNLATGALDLADVAICGDHIAGVGPGYRGRVEVDARNRVVVPGFIDTHVHVESTLVTPAEFDRLALTRGTTTAISDPHEICNVLGAPGLAFFLESSRHTAMDLRVQLSSCVPSTALETAGARLTADDLLAFRDHPSVIGLAEFMNVPGVLNLDDEVLDKLAAFDGAHIDGHSPLLSGRELDAYLACGIRNCHECTERAEALEKIGKGMQVLIRDGSVSKDVATLAPLLDWRNSPFFAFCTDDRNPLDIAEEGHMDHLIRAAIRAGAPVGAVYRAATWSAAQGFGLKDRGLVAPGRRADLVVLDDLETCAVATVIRDGRVVDEGIFDHAGMPAQVGFGSVKLPAVTPDIFRMPAAGPGAPVIGIRPGSLITDHLTLTLPYVQGERRADPGQDALKVAVLARHGSNRNVGRGFVKGFGFPAGAIASSVGHDSHNLCVVGACDADMAVAVNRLITLGGGFVVVRDGRVLAELALPVAGLMSDRDAAHVHDRLIELRHAARALGCRLAEPFLQLAFLPLPVIPHLKITDFGLVDVDHFKLLAA